jgi:hypothetical protein
MALKVADVKKEVAEVLKWRPVYNGSLLNVVERNCHEDCRIVGNSVRIFDKLSGVYMFSVGAWEEVEVLMDEVDSRLDTFLVNDAAYIPQIVKRYPKADYQEYLSLILLKDEYVPYTEINPEVEIVPLDMSWLDFILENYHDKEFGNEAYISHRIQHGPGLGLLYKGQRISFLLQHKNGESGPQVVLPVVRGMGLGTYLLRHFNNILLEKNSTLVSIVEPGNIASMHMVRKSGYIHMEKNIVWVYRKLHNTLYLP